MKIDTRKKSKIELFALMSFFLSTSTLAATPGPMTGSTPNAAPPGVVLPPITAPSTSSSDSASPAPAPAPAPAFAPPSTPGQLGIANPNNSFSTALANPPVSGATLINVTTQPAVKGATANIQLSTITASTSTLLNLPAGTIKTMTVSTTNPALVPPAGKAVYFYDSTTGNYYNLSSPNIQRISYVPGILGYNYGTVATYPDTYPTTTTPPGGGNIVVDSLGNAWQMPTSSPSP